MSLHANLLPFSLTIFMLLLENVSARFCEGGHICTLPRECCTQGCCPPYQGGPRQLPPPSEHVLNLFFISHWFFWCVVVAIILAILCAYSLWKKRRTLCGWGFTEHHTQSEGDSAGSCYAPPQYSRCNSFHHPPPPYTEVTSKPDLYPLVFTCNSDNGKNGSSYLMVQYFRNYIVRPAGSLSAASTVDSLSSSFICNANEANTLVPPPYSRAASPDIGYANSFQQQAQQQLTQHASHHGQQCILPRSASQLVCANVSQQQDYHGAGMNIAAQQVYQQRSTPHYTTVTLSSAIGAAPGVVGAGAGSGSGANGNGMLINQSTGMAAALTLTPLDCTSYNARLPASESGNFTHDDSGESSRSGSTSSNAQRTTGFIQSHSDQHFCYIANSNSSISDIFVNNSCTAGISGTGGGVGGVGATANATGEMARTGNSSLSSLAIAAGGTPVIYSNGCIKPNPNPLHRVSTNPTQLTDTQTEQVYDSCNSIGGISITVPVASTDGADNEFRDLQLLRHSLETCCQLLHQQQQQQPQQQAGHHHHQQQQQQPIHAQLPSSYANSDDSPLHMQELIKKYTEEAGLRSYVTSGTVSGVSSLANIGTPSSPPQATSPTGEVKDILDQIRLLQEGVSYEELMFKSSNTNTSTNNTNNTFSNSNTHKPKLQHTLSSPSQATAHTKHNTKETISPLQRYASISIPEQPKIQSTHGQPLTTLRQVSISTVATKPSHVIAKRPLNLHQTTVAPIKSKKYYTPKPNKAMYMPMMSTDAAAGATSGSPPTATLTGMGATSLVNRCAIKSPVSSVVGANFFVNRGRACKGWISRSAPTTPGTGLPPNRLGDDSPLLHEHDEDAEGEQNAELE